MDKLAKEVVESNHMTPANAEWLIGGNGDGYVLADVLKDGKPLHIKLDVFTKAWEEVKSSE
ncbi:hypothetical protein D3C73_1604370 [compost metagenome]